MMSPFDIDLNSMTPQKFPDQGSTIKRKNPRKLSSSVNIINSGKKEDIRSSDKDNEGVGNSYLTDKDNLLPTSLHEYLDKGCATNYISKNRDCHNGKKI